MSEVNSHTGVAGTIPPGQTAMAFRERDSEEFQIFNRLRNNFELGRAAAVMVCEALVARDIPRALAYANVTYFETHRGQRDVENGITLLSTRLSGATQKMDEVTAPAPVTGLAPEPEGSVLDRLDRVVDRIQGKKKYTKKNAAYWKQRAKTGNTKSISGMKGKKQRASTIKKIKAAAKARKRDKSGHFIKSKSKK